MPLLKSKLKFITLYDISGGATPKNNCNLFYKKFHKNVININ